MIRWLRRIVRNARADLTRKPRERRDARRHAEIARQCRDAARDAVHQHGGISAGHPAETAADRRFNEAAAFAETMGPFFAPPPPPRRRAPQRAPAPRRLRPEEAGLMLARLPTHHWTAANAREAPRLEDDTAKRCTICLSDYAVGDELRTLPCLHAFHCECIDRWLVQSDAICPVCRTPAL